MSTVQNTSVNVYTLARDLPSDITPALERYSLQANVILPMLQSSQRAEMMGESITTQQVWVVHRTNSNVDLILSCTNGTLGTYPAFIVATVPAEQLTYEYLTPRLQSMIVALCEVASTRRVYSVFATELITNLFVDLWSRHTGIQAIPTPYYDSWMSYCTRRSLVERKLTAPTNCTYDIRPANNSDIDQIAELCYGFAAECPPFTLSREDSRKEAASLVKKNQIWVHRINEGGASNIASICALTRNTAKVATITKVYTNPHFRKRGCAERLVRHVCRHLLTAGGKESVVLYVGTDNPAGKVYGKVGFVGLTSNESREGAERWVEVGFDQAKVDLGHW